MVWVLVVVVYRFVVSELLGFGYRFVFGFLGFGVGTCWLGFVGCRNIVSVYGCFGFACFVFSRFVVVLVPVG